MRNIYTSIGLGSYRKVSKIGHNTHTHTHTRGNTTMRNIYTSIGLGSYRKVSKIGHNKSIIW